MACTEVTDPRLVEVMRSCNSPISVARVGWYPTAEGMRPKSAETSEPAWVKRKMLSTKNSTSWPWSRKYSATVRPLRPTRARRLVHLAVHQRALRFHIRIGMARVGVDLRFDELVIDVFALANTLADA